MVTSDGTIKHDQFQLRGKAPGNVGDKKKCRCWKCLRERRLACRMSLHHHDHEQPQTWMSKPCPRNPRPLCSSRVQFMHELRGGLARLFLSSVASKLSARILCSHAYKTITWPWQFPVQDFQKRVFCHKIPSNCGQKWCSVQDSDHNMRPL